MIKTEADVIIVAAGMSGICAAAAAAEKGASVIAFEKGGTVGGAASMGMGFFAVESHIQKKQLDGLTVDKAFQMFMEYNHWRSDAKLVRKLFGQTASTVKWVEDMGVEWLGAFKYFNDSECTWHLPKVPGSNRIGERCGSILTKAIFDRAKELGVKFYFNTPVTELLYDGNRVYGVRARGEDGAEYEAESDAVIVCTGGFGDNPEMIKELLGYDHGKDLFSFRIPGLKGEGMKMVWAIGGGRTPVNMEMTYECPGDSGNPGTETIMRQPNLLVNVQGQRFINEEIMRNTPFTGNAINLQKGKVGYSIVTDEIVDYYRERGIDFNSYHKTLNSIDDWDEGTRLVFDTQNAQAEGPGNGRGSLMGLEDSDRKFFFRADSLEDLAAQTGIDFARLKKTIDEYNAMCDSGGDAFFGKQQRYMLPIRGKTYYVMEFHTAGYGSLGGIKVNDMLQVVTDGNEPIPGLYSAGTDCCSIFGDSYMFYFPGSTMSFAVNSGRMAGYNAVDYIDSEDFVE